MSKGNGQPKKITFLEQYCPNAMREINAHLRTSQSKHGPGLYEKPLSCRSQSIQNHRDAWEEGDDIDDESGGSHIASIAAQAIVMLEHFLLKNDLDDREI